MFRSCLELSLGFLKMVSGRLSAPAPHTADGKPDLTGAMGHPRSEAMHVTERFHRVDFGHLDTEMTFDDPALYTRKSGVRISYELVPGNIIFEMFCEQNEKDRKHMVK
jgi:hypothetical protein